MYQYDSKQKTQSEKSNASTPATNKDHAQKVMKMPIQAKSIFSPSLNQENDDKNTKLDYTSRPIQLMPMSYSPLQMQLMPKQEQGDINPLPIEPSEEQKRLALAPTKPNNTGIPLQMKEKFEHLSGFSFDDVKVHYNSDKPMQLQALAYTQGNRVYVAPGQERHLEHELGHVVQQKQGRVYPNKRLNNIPINDDHMLESEANSFRHVSTAQMKGTDGNVIQRMRICLNKDVIKKFQKLRNVVVSEKDPVVDNVGGGEFEKLRRVVVSEKDPVVDDEGGIIKKEYKVFKTEEGSAENLTEDEDIVFEGHGYWFLGQSIEGKKSGWLSEEVVEIIQKSPFRTKKKPGADVWKGRVVLLACNTRPMVQDLSDALYDKLGYRVTVVGTKGVIKDFTVGGADIVKVYYEDEKLNPNPPEIVSYCQALLQVAESLIKSIDFKRPITQEIKIEDPRVDAFTIEAFEEARTRINYFLQTSSEPVSDSSAASSSKAEDGEKEYAFGDKQPDLPVEIQILKDELLAILAPCSEIVRGAIDFTNPRHVVMFPAIYPLLASTRAAPPPHPERPE